MTDRFVPSNDPADQISDEAKKEDASPSAAKEKLGRRLSARIGGLFPKKEQKKAEETATKGAEEKTEEAAAPKAEEATAEKTEEAAAPKAEETAAAEPAATEATPAAEEAKPAAPA